MYRFCSFLGKGFKFGSHRSICSFLVSRNLTLPITVAVAQSVSMKDFSAWKVGKAAAWTLVKSSGVLAMNFVELTLRYILFCSEIET